MVGIEAASHEPQNQPASFKKSENQSKGTFLSENKFLLAGFGIFRSKEDPGSFKNPKTSQKELFRRRKSSFWLVFSLKSLEKNIRTLLLCCFSFASSCNIYLLATIHEWNANHPV